ncbi:MAG: hypothetical protein F9K16_05100 [Thermoanaerobaculia bacterium]|nr:MAG: hypothetical protein F9K16_05100 [Thermoanaerobaculia bacterium]
MSIDSEPLLRLSNKEVGGPGFTVRVPSIHEAEYREGDRVATIEIEGGTGELGDVNWLVYSETLKSWRAPHDMEELSARKREQILQRISKAFRILDLTHEVV